MVNRVKHEVVQDIAQVAPKVGPAVGGAVYTVMNLPLADWVAIITFIYIVLQIGLLIPKYWKTFFKK